MRGGSVRSEGTRMAGQCLCPRFPLIKDGIPTFVTVASVDDLAPGDGMVVEADEEEIGLFNVDGEFYAIGNSCTHVGGPLDGTTVTCPLHGSDFDVTSGACLGPPADDAVPSYEVRVEGSEIQVAV